MKPIMQVDKGREVERWNSCTHKGVMRKSMRVTASEMAKEALRR